jgi:hypothetical protein
MARIDSLSASDATAKAGVMFRERNDPVTTDADCAEVYTAAYRDGTILQSGARTVAVVRKPDGSMQMVYRSTTGGAMATAGTADANLGPYAKLIRSGDVFTGYCSPDGTIWTQIGQVTLTDMAEKIEMGMAVASGNSNNPILATAIFSAFSRVESTPVANAQSVTVDEDTSAAITLTGSDAYGTSLSCSVVSQPANGTLTGTVPNLIYTPNADYFGIDSFTFEVNDGFADSATATVSITVESVEDLPYSGTQPALAVIGFDHVYSSSLADSSVDPDGDTLTYSLLSGPNWLSVMSDGTLSGTPSSSDVGINSWTIEVFDGNGNTANTTLNIAVVDSVLIGYDFDTGAADWTAATIVPAHVTASPFTSPMDISQITGDGDASGVDAAGIDFGSTGTLGSVGVQVIDATTGSFEAAIAGDDYMSFTVTPDAGSSLHLYSVTFKVAMKSVNAVDEYAVTDALGNLIGNAAVITNATGITGTYQSVSVSLIDTALETIDGATEFRIYAWGRGTSSTTSTIAALDKVTLHGVGIINTAPVADDKSVDVDEDELIAITLSGSDAEGDSLSYKVTGSVSDGSLGGTAPNLTYTPNANFNGSDSFTFTVNDGTVDSAEATVSITVDPVNDVPVADAKSVTVDEDNSVAITLSGSDIDGDSLSYDVDSGPANGSLSGNAPNLTYAPDADYNGTDSFTYTVNDGTVDSAAAMVSITVNPMDEEPIATESVVIEIDDDVNGWTQQGAGAGNNLVKDGLTADDGSALWGVSNGSDAMGLLYEDYTSIVGTTLSSTIQAGTYTLSLRIGNGSVYDFTGLNDISADTNTDMGAVAGFFATVGADAQASKNNMYTEFNGVSGVTYFAPTEADPADQTWTTWTFTWVIEEGSPVIGSNPFFGVYNRTGGTDNFGTAFFDDSILTYVVPDEPNLIASWSMDDGAGSIVADGTANGFDATMSGATWVTGFEGDALEFDGISSTVTLPAEAFASIDDEITVAMWVYGGDNQPRNDSIFYAVNSSGDRVLNVHLPWGNGSVYWDAGYEGTYDRIYKGASSAQYKGQWNHWVFTKNATSGEMAIYVNGVLWHSGTGKTKSMAGITSAALGSQISSLSYEGTIDDVRLYNESLDATAVSDLYFSYLPGAYAQYNGGEEYNPEAVTLAYTLRKWARM